MMHNFESTESWECWRHIKVRQQQVGITPTSLLSRPAFTINKPQSLPLWKFHLFPLWKNAW